MCWYYPACLVRYSLTCNAISKLPQSAVAVADSYHSVAAVTSEEHWIVSHTHPCCAFGFLQVSAAARTAKRIRFSVKVGVAGCGKKEALTNKNATAQNKHDPIHHPQLLPPRSDTG